MPRSAIFLAVTRPTPGIRLTGNRRTKLSLSSGEITKSPSGLSQSEAIFAKNLFPATPAEAIKPVF